MTTYSFCDRPALCSGAQRNAASEPFLETRTGDCESSELNVDELGSGSPAVRNILILKSGCGLM